MLKKFLLRSRTAATGKPPQQQKNSYTSASVVEMPVALLLRHAYLEAAV